MKALILCAGEGTRMNPITLEIPKPMLPIKGKPVLEHIISLFKEYSINDIIINVYHLKQKIKDYFKDGRDFGINISYIEEEILSGTAGPIKKISKEIDDTFFVSNGDELKDLDLDKMYDFHKKNKAFATIALKEVKNPSKYGVVKLNKDKIIDFVEKPEKGKEPSNLINAGLYLFEPEVIKYIPDGFSKLEVDIFPKLIRKGKVFGYKFNGQWFDTGNFKRYEEAIKNWAGITKKISK